jgi:hypothetical protein
MISSLAMFLYSKKFREIPRVTDEEFAPVNVKDEEMQSPSFANQKGTPRHVPPVSGQ